MGDVFDKLFFVPKLYQMEIHGVFEPWMRGGGGANGMPDVFMSAAKRISTEDANHIRDRNLTQTSKRRSFAPLIASLKVSPFYF